MVVMIGDSITEQHLYSNYVEMWTVTRFPHWKLTFRNTGIGGDRSTGGNTRFRRDVLTYHPTAMTVDFGMNDGNYAGFNERTYRTYMSGLEGMAKQAREAHIRVAWITPQPLDNGDQGKTALVGYNKTLERFSAGVDEIAKSYGGVFVNQFHPYLHVLDKARAASSHYDRITGGDAVHPGPAGQSLMAASILKGLHFPRLVSTVEINAAAKTVVAAHRCKVTEIKHKDGGLAFTRHDEALPFFPPEAMGILRWAPLLEEMNDYHLKVVGLQHGKYNLRIGGTKVAEVTEDELAHGINLAAAVLAAGPIREQVLAVKAAVEAKNRFHHDRIFRGVVLSGIPDWIKLPPQVIEEQRRLAVEERLVQLQSLDEAVNRALAMKSHHVELTPVHESECYRPPSLNCERRMGLRSRFGLGSFLRAFLAVYLGLPKLTAKLGWFA